MCGIGILVGAIPAISDPPISVRNRRDNDRMIFVVVVVVVLLARPSSKFSLVKITRIFWLV